MIHQHSGMHYHEFLRRLQVATPVRSYLEIGVNKGRSLRHIRCGAIGVDPKFIIDCDVRGNKPFLHLLELTSDQYFDAVSTEKIFPAGVDVAFLDGLHLFEHLLDDFINVEPLMAEDGIVLMHDCLPINAEMTERIRRPAERKDPVFKSHWTGDVWKLVPILKSLRPDLTIHLLDCAPTGLVAIQGFDKYSSALRDSRVKIVEEYHLLEMTDETIDSFYNDHSILSASRYISQISMTRSVATKVTKT